MWVEDIFGGKDKDGKDTVKVETELINVMEDAWFLKWSVTRL